MSTLSHEIFKLLLQLRVLVVDAPHDGMLKSTVKQAKPIQCPQRGARSHKRVPGVSKEVLTFPDGSGTARTR
jgi:hypothetical protein